MSIHVNGVDTGVNNGIVTTIRSAYGYAHISVKLPDTLMARDVYPANSPSNVPAHLNNGFIASADADCDPSVEWPRIYRFIMTLTITGTGINLKYTFSSKKFKCDFKLPVGWNGVLNFSYTTALYAGGPGWETAYKIGEKPGYPNANHWNRLGIVWAYSSFNYTIPVSDRIIRSVDAASAFEVRDLAIPANATELRLATYSASGLTAKLMDDVALEIPVSKWLPKMLNVCDWITGETVSESQALCRFVHRKGEVESPTWSCRLRRIACDGHKSKDQCASYLPLPKCMFIMARELLDYDAPSGTVTINDDKVKHVFNQKTGLGFIPTDVWRFANEDLKVIQTASMAAVDRAASFYCHKFERPEDHPNALPCYASEYTKMPWALMGQNTFWRYVRDDLTLDLTCAERNWQEIVLRNHDIPLSNPTNMWPDESQIVGAIAIYEGKPDLAPTYNLPDDVPNGLYDVWMYVKNTSQLPLALTCKYPRKFEDIQQVAPVWQIPASSDFAWVKLIPSGATVNALSGGAKLGIDILNGSFGINLTGAHFDIDGEFAFRSLYIERV
jgi:hypothetical protein